MNYEAEGNGAFFMRKTVIVAAFSVLTFGLCAGIAGAQVPTSGNVYSATPITTLISRRTAAV